MPRDINDKQQNIRTKIASRNDFIQKNTKAVKKPLKKKMTIDKKGELFSIRNKRLAIREAALKRFQMDIVYHKTTTHETKLYTVAPYSYRYKKLKIGIRKMLFAYDMKDKHIKQFALVNIRSVKILKRVYTPKWPVEII